ncbi:hypothetical protein TREAZ_2950 [Leadbettera azotonutricia ZAS-9]|uniref:Uncharacterized protein n=1 Tax=Leadbettera azotonutricia (strain ATCC BAA-888 / DSM 13862 / ZAS-9) TaxID=545695 RepID=F5YBR9_LEAAZ|nr:hypothetical protein TREAZ_2950 [Leadbettera azotonutricia ZAS-9]
MRSVFNLKDSFLIRSGTGNCLFGALLFFQKPALLYRTASLFGVSSEFGTFA